MTREDKRSPFDANLDAIVTKALEELHGPGLALGVVDGEQTWFKAFGFSDTETKTKVTPKTMFSVGNTTKSFTAAAASILVDDNPDITWDTPIHTLIPEDFVLEDSYATTHITIADCLSHRTGMPGHRADLGGPSVKQNTRNMRHLPLGKWQLRLKWDYSNHMYWAVSHMIEKVSGKDLGTFMKERIWTPLGMDATFFSIKDALAYEKENEDPDVHLAKHHVWDNETKSFKVIPYWNDAGVSGAGSMVSNVIDYTKWIRSFIDQDGKGPLSAAGYQAVTAPHMVMPPISPKFIGPICYGFGWFIAVYHGEKVLYHPGGVLGAVADMIFLPDRKWGVVGMCSATADSALDAVMWHLIDDFLGVPAEKRTDVIARRIQATEMMKTHNNGAKERLFPSVRSPPLPPPVPLGDYTGSYSHPAYGTITFTVDEGSSGLHGHFPARLPFDSFFLEHISGEFFLAKVGIMEVQTFRLKARFELDPSGVPLKLGMEFEEDDPDVIIWFAREKEESKDLESRPKD